MESLLQYFKETQKLLEANDFPTPTDRQTFLENVFAEMEGKEYRLACSHDGSVHLESLLKEANEHQLGVFFEKIKERVVECSQHRYASHVVETWIQVSLKHASLLHCIDEVQQMFMEDLEMFAQNPYATHILRLIISAWDGRIAGFQGDVDGRLASMMQTIIVDKKLSSFKKLVCNQQAGPLMQLIFDISCKRNFHFHSLLANILPGPFDGNKIDKNQETINTFNRIANDQFGSRFLETVFSVIDADLWQALFEGVVGDCCAALAQGPNSNFVLQTLISCAPNARSFKTIITALQSQVASFVKARRHGILLRLVLWCTKNEFECAQLVMDQIYIALGISVADGAEQSKYAFTHLLILTILDKAKRGAGERKGAVGNISIAKAADISTAGCSIIQHLLSFPMSISKPLLDGFLDISVDETLLLCKHPNGSRIVEALLKSGSVEEKVKQRTIRKLRDHIGHLATDKYASHCVDCAFKNATVEMQSKICEKLVENRQLLESSSYGRLVLRNTGALDWGAQDASEWSRKQEAKTRKKEMFADILEADENVGKVKATGNTTSSIHQHSSKNDNGTYDPQSKELKKKQKKKKRSAEQKQEREKKKGKNLDQ